MKFPIILAAALFAAPAAAQQAAPGLRKGQIYVDVGFQMTESWTHEEFLAACLQREVAAREAHGGEGRIRAARFPARKSLEEFDFDHARGLKRDTIAHLGTLDFAEVFARIGDKDRAFEALEFAIEMRDHRMSQLKVNPLYDPLRSDPRFTELLRRMKLTP